MKYDEKLKDYFEIASKPYPGDEPNPGKTEIKLKDLYEHEKGKEGKYYVTYDGILRLSIRIQNSQSKKLRQSRKQKMINIGLSLIIMMLRTRKTAMPMFLSGSMKIAKAKQQTYVKNRN